MYFRNNIRSVLLDNIDIGECLSRLVWSRASNGQIFWRNKENTLESVQFLVIVTDDDARLLYNYKEESRVSATIGSVLSVLVPWLDAVSGFAIQVNAVRQLYIQRNCVMSIVHVVPLYQFSNPTNDPGWVVAP